MLHIPWVKSSYWVRNISEENLINSDKNQITSTQRSGSHAKSPDEPLLRHLIELWMHLCFLVPAKVCLAKGFYEKEVVCLFSFGLNKTARKNQKDVTQLSLLAQSLVLTYLKLPFQGVHSKYYPFLKYKRIPSFHQNVLSSPCKPYYWITY